MAQTTSILSVTNRPLQYIITQNKSTIDLLKESGSLIVYEPNASKFSNEYRVNTYRELWVGSYFLASGFGAKTSEEQEKLSYIADSYNATYDYLIDYTNKLYTYSYNLYDNLNEHKATIGDENIELDNKYIDLSYNTIQFGDNKIRLNNLYEQFQNFRVYDKFEIISVDYAINVYNQNENITNEYHNFSNIPNKSKISNITITIKGNTKDTMGISKIEVKYNNKINSSNNVDVYDFSVDNLEDSTEAQTYNNSSPNSFFEIKLNKSFSKNEYEYIIESGQNNIISELIITAKPLESTEDHIIIQQTAAQQIELIKDYPCIVIGVDTIYLYKEEYKDKDITEPEHIFRINNINNYVYTLLNEDEQLICNISKGTQYISILIDNNIRLISAEFMDATQNCIYDIIDFIQTKYGANNQGITIGNTIYKVQYVIDLFNDVNSNYNNRYNTPFVYKDNNNKMYLNSGKIKFTFITSQEKPNMYYKNTSQYWITYNPEKGDIDFPI